MAQERAEFPADVNIQVRKEHSLTRTKEIELGRAVQSGSLEAQKILFESNLGIVNLYVRRYSNKGVEIEDLFQEGYISLIKAIRTFDPERGTRFATYAGKIIKNDMVSIFADQASWVHIPHSVYSQYSTIQKTIEKYRQDNAINPTLEEISNLTSISQQKIQQLIIAVTPPLSLSAPVKIKDHEEGSILDDLIDDNKNKSVEEIVIAKCLKEDIEALLLQLPEREAFILKYRFGLNNEIPKTQKELAEIFGVTHSYIYLLEKKGINIIRETSRIECLQDYLE